MSTSKTISVKGSVISIVERDHQDYISLTDMMRANEGEFFISNWLRNRNTIEFLGVWERIHNPNFNCVEFDTIKSQAGLNSYRLSISDWVEKTNAIGIFSKAGRYGGTYAHRDIAFEFGMWISAEFKVYLIREFDRLKEQEATRLSGEWNLVRTLSKINYRIHTDAVKEELIPLELSKEQQKAIYASQADVLNVAMFGQTAAQWRHANKGKEGNIRDHCTIEQLLILSNMESLNAEFIRQEMPQDERLLKLNQSARRQMRSLLGIDIQIKRLK